MGNSVRGFSLIELLIVLSMFALAAMIIAPGVQSSLTRAEARAAAIELRTKIATLRAKAWERQIRIILVDPTNPATQSTGGQEDAGGAPVETATITLAPGWGYKLSEPIIFEPHGVCNGGLARVENKSGAGLDMTLRPPFCATELR